MIEVEALYERHGKQLYNLALRMTGRRDTAEDVVHEVFVRVIEHAADFRGESSLYTWLFSITRNVCMRLNQRSVRGLEKAIEAATSDPPRSFSDELERAFYVDQVKDGCLTGLLQCLSFYQRIAFIMSVLFEVPTTDIAEMLGKTANSVRVLVSRAKSNIRSFLCANCSHYEPSNRCRCENMVDFSIRHGLISEHDPSVSPSAVQAELKDLRTEVELYQSLKTHEPPAAFLDRLRSRDDLKLMSPGKR